LGHARANLLERRRRSDKLQRGLALAAISRRQHWRPPLSDKHAAKAGKIESGGRIKAMISITRIRCATALIGLALMVSSSARAEDMDFSGSWSVSGRIVTGNLLTWVSPICVFQQTEDQLKGSCKGPNGAGSATGAIDGADISWQWHMVATNAIGLNGLSTFRGTLGRDNVIRGSWTFSHLPNSSGTFTAQKM
jgi:hypothetical protein